MICPVVMRIADDALDQTNATGAGSSAPNAMRRHSVKPTRLTFPRWNFFARACAVVALIEFGSATRIAASLNVRRSRGENQLRVLPNERAPADANDGTPLPDSKVEQPPVIRRTEVVAFALVALLVICVVAVLYVAKAFFLPIVMAFIVGTMLSPAAGFLERCRIPRAVSAAVLIVGAVGAGAAFMVGLISSPLMEWSTRLPELGAQLKDKTACVRPAAGALAGTAEHARRTRRAGTAFQMPKFDWVQPTLEFLSPTFAEFLLFIATLILFIASWRDLRRALIMTFARSRRRGCACCGSSTRSRSISAAIC